MKEFFSQRGFVITVDSFLGVTLLFLLIVLSFFYLSQTAINSWNTIDLRDAVFDEATVLEKSLVLETAVNQSSSEGILSSLDSTQASYCFEVSILNPDDFSIAINALKTGCIKHADESFSFEKTLVVNSNGTVSFYVARIEGWSK